jgi:hypothetical protein
MTASFTSKFSPPNKEKSLNLPRGTVIRAHTSLTDPPKIKLFVVWGFEETKGKIGISFINTESIPLDDPILQKSQLFLPSAGRPYLTHDSYLDCSRIYEEDLIDIKGIISEDPEAIKGKLSQEDLAEAEELIIFSPTVVTKLKKRYGFIIGN